MALLVELVMMILVIGAVGGSVAALAERSSRPGALSLRETIANIVGARPRSPGNSATSRPSLA